MIIFVPVHLKESVFKALNNLSFMDGDILGIPFSVLLNETQYEEYEGTITEDSEVCLYEGEGDYPHTTLKYLLYINSEWTGSKINEKQSYAKSKKEVDFLLNITDYNTLMLLEALGDSSNAISNTTIEGTELWGSRITVNQRDYYVCLFKGLCLYHFLVKKSGNYDKYLPSYSGDDYFVRITCDTEIHFPDADSLAVSLVFELQATHGLVLEFSDGRPDPDYTYYDEDELSNQPYNIFPLLFGKGIHELLQIYNNAKSSTNVEYRILSFTKVIEYISPTIAKEKLYEDVRLKLTSPAVFNPTATYINELGEVYRNHQYDIGKDSELIKLAVYTTITVNDIWNILPQYLKSQKIQSPTDMDEDAKVSLINSIISAIYDTRNEIAHAKANYVKKGKECPNEQKQQFSMVVDVIAIKCIRWFALQPENKRVILSI